MSLWTCIGAIKTLTGVFKFSTAILGHCLGSLVNIYFLSVNWNPLYNTKCCLEHEQGLCCLYPSWPNSLWSKLLCATNFLFCNCFGVGSLFCVPARAQWKASCDKSVFFWIYFPEFIYLQSYYQNPLNFLQCFLYTLILFNSVFVWNTSFKGTCSLSKLTFRTLQLGHPQPLHHTG